VDPHKGSHTAVAIGGAEEPLGELRVRACAAQAERLLSWAADWPERTWAAGGAAGLGHLLAQQLLAAGERVLDVQPKLGARVRLLATGAVNKNDPNDARSVAVAALRSPARREVRPDDHAAVLKVWSKRHRDLGRTRTQVACRLHAVLCELVPGGVSKEITAAHAAQLLESITPSGAVEAARCELTAEFPGDLRRTGTQIRDADKVMHGQLENDAGYTVMASDHASNMGEYHPPSGFGISLGGDDGDVLRGYWEKLSASGNTAMPMQKQPWGDEFGIVVDQFGITWLVNISQPQA
jgi:uncharacterized glyoxalase superfamily protein PhnB